MYCPLCGTKLNLQEKKPPEIDFNLPPKDRQRQRQIKDNEEFWCPKGCFAKDFPLLYHHPFGGIDSAPGDSWSLSWVK
jgi:hypothetical protein